jgi:beta-lactamase family protein
MANPTRICVVVIAVFTLASICAPVALAQTERTQSDPTGYWWYYGATPAQVSQYLSQNNARIVDLQVESVSSTGPVFTVSMVSNAGAYARQWWWWYGQSATDVEQKLANLNARLISISPYQDGNNLHFAVAMVSNTGANAKQWWWWYGAGSYIGSQLNGLNARVVDLENYTFNGSEQYAAIAIANTGADAAPWWWWFNVTPSQIGTDLQRNPAQLLTLARDGNGNYDATMQGNPPAEWWYYYGLNEKMVWAYLEQNGARPIEMRSYFPSGTRTFDTVMINNSNSCTTRLGNILREFAGWSGVYLKEVGGPVLCSLNDGRPFEPASAIKIVVSTYAMQQVQGGRATLNDRVPLLLGDEPSYCAFKQVSIGTGNGSQTVFTGTLPTGNGPLYPNSLFVVAGGVTGNDNGSGAITGHGVSGAINYGSGAISVTYNEPPANGTQLLIYEKLSAAIQGMMQNSDDARTDMLMQRYGLPTLTTFAHSIAMPNTQLNQYVNCSGPGSANYLTLDDGDHLYDGLATGALLTPANVQALFAMMAGKNYDFSGIWGSLKSIISQEAPAGLSSGQVSAFETAVQLSQKSGGYSWPGGNTSIDGFTVYSSGGNVGWVQIPFCNGSSQTSRQYVFGFLGESTDATQASQGGSWNAMGAGAEILREQVRSALSTWGQCSH